MLLLSLTSYVTSLIFNGGTRTQRAPHRRRHVLNIFELIKRKNINIFYAVISRNGFSVFPDWSQKQISRKKKKNLFSPTFVPFFARAIYGPNPSDKIISRENCSRNSETPTTFRRSPPLVPRPERLSPSVQSNRTLIRYLTNATGVRSHNI